LYARTFKYWTVLKAKNLVGISAYFRAILIEIKPFF